MKYFKLSLIGLTCLFCSMCTQLREERYNKAADTTTASLMKIDYAFYKGKTIGYFLDKEKVKYKRFTFLEDEYSGCLSNAKFSLGYDIYLYIYCPEESKYIQKCDGNIPRLWNLEDFKKEKMTKILLVQRFPQLKEVTVFPREKSP